MPPATPSATPSGIVAKDGERVVPASVRADGSYVGAAYAGFARSAACAQAIRPMRMWRGSAHRVCCRRTARDLRPAARVSAGPRRGRYRGRQRGRPSRSPLALDGTSRPTRALPRPPPKSPPRPPPRRPSGPPPRSRPARSPTRLTPEKRTRGPPRIPHPSGAVLRDLARRQGALARGPSGTPGPSRRRRLPTPSRRSIHWANPYRHYLSRIDGYRSGVSRVRATRLSWCCVSHEHVHACCSSAHRAARRLRLW